MIYFAGLAIDLLYAISTLVLVAIQVCADLVEMGVRCAGDGEKTVNIHKNVAHF
jgi:hypothetical protein